MQLFLIYLYMMIGACVFVYGARSLNITFESKVELAIRVMAYFMVCIGYMVMWPAAVLLTFYIAFKNRSKS